MFTAVVFSAILSDDVTPPPSDVIVGASLTLVMLIVSVFAERSRLVPPPLSSTWNVKVVLPFTLAAGSYVRFGISATATNSSAATAMPPSLRVPEAGSVEIFTRLNALAPAAEPASSGSVKPKLLAANV